MLEIRNYIREMTKVRGSVKGKDMMVESLKPIGVITDRDITWRVVAAGKIPAQTSVRDAMLSELE
jgi:hypothetical protein